MSRNAALFNPLKIGSLVVPNRILMAPLTRNRAQADGTPKEMAADYYRQRASAGLIVSEATQISAMGKGYLDTPGIYNEGQVAAWRTITDAVHAGGGRIFCQLWHVGRISHVSLLPDGRSPLSSTATRAESKTFTANGFEDCSKPESMTLEQISETIEDYRHAARCAMDAGFDGVEVHAANGYLLDQFLQDGVNDRTDEYGGTIENRMRILQEVFEAVFSVWPSDRVGVRLSPLGQANDMSDSNPEEHFAEVCDFVSGLNLAYLHVIEQFPGNETESSASDMLKRLRKRYEGTYIGNGGYDATLAASAIDDGRIDAVTIGIPFIANPDLPERYRTGAHLNEADQDTFYGGGREGYTDYPFLAHS